MSEITKEHLTNTIHEISRDFIDGLIAGFIPRSINETKSEHWLAGFDAGWSLHDQRNTLLNNYIKNLVKK